MYDAIGANAAQLASLVPNAEMVAWYGTGSADIDWSLADRERFPHSVMVEIDQGFTGSPVPAAIVRDVENGAWTPGAAVDKSNWTAARPTIYCNRSTLTAVIAAGWKGDVWLAWPGFSGTTPPVYPGVNVVAVQNTWAGWYDASIVFDPTWPAAKPVVSAAGHLSITVNSRTADMAWTVVDTATVYDIVYHPLNGTPGFSIASVPQPAMGGAVHAADVLIPGSHGGSIVIEATVSGVSVPVAMATLP
jgi:hypothetical protein